MNANVPTGTVGIPWSGLTLHYANTSVNQEEGKGATVSINYTLTASSSPRTLTATTGGCKFETNFKVRPPVLNPAITVIGGHESVSFKDGSITLTNDPNINQIACQGATVTLSYVLK